MGAHPYTKPEDIIEILFPIEVERARKAREKEAQLMLFGDTEEEKMVVRKLVEGVRDGEEIMEQLGIDVATFNQTITMLEIKGVVRALGMNNWTLR